MENELKAAQARIAELEAALYAERIDADDQRRELDSATQNLSGIRAELAALKAQEPTGWYTEDHLDDKSATTYSWTVAERWVEKGWPVSPLYAAPVSEAKAQGVVMPDQKFSEDWHSEFNMGEVHGWNTCLDEVARLNGKGGV